MITNSLHLLPKRNDVCAWLWQECVAWVQPFQNPRYIALHPRALAIHGAVTVDEFAALDLFNVADLARLLQDAGTQQRWEDC